MTHDLTTSPQDDLQHFVVRTRYRLKELLNSLNNLREATTDSAAECAPLVDDLSAASVPTADEEAHVEEPHVEEPHVEEPHVEEPRVLQREQAQRQPAQPTHAAEERPRSAADDGQIPIDDVSDAAERLLAIKRRLAQQLKNP